MKRKLSYLFSTLIIIGSVALPMTALADHGSSTTSVSSDSTTSSSSDSSGTSSSDTTQIETETHDRTERLSQFKEAFKVKLSLAEIEHIKLKCVGAQGVVGKLNNKFGNSITVRTQAYTELQKNLDKLVTKLKAKNVDTTTLEQDITTLKSKITTYSTDLAAYKQALSDLKDVSCKTDPNGFQAALLAARSAHDTLVTDVKAIRSYLVDTIKPELQTIKNQLEGQN